MENLHQSRRLVIDLRRAQEAEAVVTDSSLATTSLRAFRRRPVNGELATRLFISPKTASVHVSNILAKLSMTSRAEIAAYAVPSGLASA